MRFWRACLSDDKLDYDTQDTKRGGQVNEGFKISSFHRSGEPIESRAFEMDVVGLIFLGSVESQIRPITLELLRCVRALRNDVRELSSRGLADYTLKYGARPIFIIDVHVEHGDDIVQSCYWDSGCPFDLR